MERIVQSFCASFQFYLPPFTLDFSAPKPIGLIIHLNGSSLNYLTYLSADFDRAKQEAVRVIKEDVKAQAKALGIDAAVGEVGAKSTNFTSLMHNCIEQGLLA